MRFSTGLLVGFAAGYYLGSKAGRERYHQIEDVLESVRGTDGYRQLRAKVSSAVDVGSDRVSDFIEDVNEQARRRATDDDVTAADPHLN